MRLLSKLFDFILLMTAKYGIDESHGLSHSMNVLHYADAIYNSEIVPRPTLANEKRSIYISALLHDMSDKKYLDENEGLKQIESFLQDDIKSEEADTIKKIISTMSYSKVKVNGYPVMPTPDKQLAYHIVREADLLTAYDFDRCMIYHMKKGNNSNIYKAFENANELFDVRVLKHLDDNLFVTGYSQTNAKMLHNEALNRMHSWKNIVSKKI